MARPNLKASQRGRVSLVKREPPVVSVPAVGEPMRWKDMRGTYRRDVGDGEHSEVLINDRVYRVKTSELIFGAIAIARGK